MINNIKNLKLVDKTVLAEYTGVLLDRLSIEYCKQGNIIESGKPTEIPESIGSITYNKQTGDIYISTGTSSLNDWVAINNTTSDKNDIDDIFSNY